MQGLVPVLLSTGVPNVGEYDHVRAGLRCSEPLALLLLFRNAKSQLPQPHPSALPAAFAWCEVTLGWFGAFLAIPAYKCITFEGRTGREKQHVCLQSIYVYSIYIYVYIYICIYIYVYINAQIYI